MLSGFAMTGFKRQKLTGISCLANSRFCNFTFFGGLAGVTSFFRGLGRRNFFLGEGLSGDRLFLVTGFL